MSIGFHYSIYQQEDNKKTSMQRTTVKTFCCLTLSAARANYQHGFSHGNNTLEGKHQYGFNGTGTLNHRLTNGKHQFRDLTKKRKGSEGIEDGMKRLRINDELTMRVYMEKETSRIWAYKELEDGAFDTAADLGLIRPDVRATGGFGTLCLWGEDHVVFQTKFSIDATSRFHVMNIHNHKSKQISITTGLKPIMVTMYEHLLVIKFDEVSRQADMFSFASPVAMSDTSSSQPANLIPARPTAYGVLKNGDVETLIVIGTVNLRRSVLQIV